MHGGEKSHPSLVNSQLLILYSTGCGSILHFVKIPDLAHPWWWV